MLYMLLNVKEEQSTVSEVKYTPSKTSKTNNNNKTCFFHVLLLFERKRTHTLSVHLCNTACSNMLESHLCSGKPGVFQHHQIILHFLYLFFCKLLLLLYQSFCDNVYLMCIYEFYDIFCMKFNKIVSTKM